MSVTGFLGVAFLVILVLGAVVYFFNNRAFSDFFGAGRAQVGKWGEHARNADPVAVMNQDIRDAQTELNSAIDDLENSKGMVTLLEEQVKQNTREVKMQESKVRTSLSDDPEDKSGKGADYAEELGRLEEQLSKNADQLTKARGIYSNNLERFRLAQSKIKTAQGRVKNLSSDLKSSETNAKLAKLAKSLNVDVNGLDNKIAAAEEETRRQIARNNAVSEVQSDLGMDGLEQAREDERLRKSAAKDKLEEYRVKMGLTKKA